VAARPWILASGLIVIFGMAMLARKPIAAYLIEDAFEDAGLSTVTLNVTRLNMGRVSIEDVAAEDGALRISRIDAHFTPWGLLGARIDAVEIDKFTAALSWREDGFRLGDFHLRPQPDKPLTVPDVRRLNVSESALTITTPTTVLQAPFSLSAELTEAGWRSALKSGLTGDGVDVAVDWNGVLTTTAPARSVGHGTLHVDIDDFAVPGVTERLDAKGQIALGAGDGALALTVNQPLSFSFDAPPLGVQSLDTLPWSITIAPSTSQAALVFTEKDGERALRFDLAATALAGKGRLRFVAAGGGVQSGKGPPRFELSSGRAEVENFPAGSGAVSGVLDLSDFVGTVQDAQGRLEASVNFSGVAVGETFLEEGQMSFASGLRIENGAATFNVKTLQAEMSRAHVAGWALAAPARVGLAGTGAEQTISVGLLSGLSGNLTLSLPALAFRKDGVTFEVEAPDIRLRAKGLGLEMAAARLALRHPAAEIREGRIDAAYNGSKLSAKSTFQVVRLGPPPDEERARSATLTVTSTLTTRGENLDLRGTLTTQSGATLGTYTARISTKAERGSWTLSVPKKRFERGGRFEAADLGFMTGISDLTGTLGLEARASWNRARRTETAVATIEDVGFAVGDVSVSGLTTTIDLSGLSPLRSAKPHHVTVQSVAVGLPLTNLAADIEFRGDEKATVTHGAVDIAGGQITIDDAAIPIGGRDGTLALGVRKIDMSKLAALAKVDGLSITGSLSGTVPLRSDQTGFYFAGGALRSDAPGRLVYKPASPPDALAQNQGGSLLLQALSNFAYDRLSIALNGPVTDDIVLGVSLAGRNPDLYGGYPIEFNLNLSGRLTQILKQGLVGYGIPTDIERQLREGQKPPGG
jgi:hypothetical protein